MDPFAPEAPVLFVSPHLDDAALSFAHFLHGTQGHHVATVFTGAPNRPEPQGWNEHTTGEPDAQNALRVRRNEDDHGMAVLGTTGHHLPLWEAQYFGPQKLAPIRDAIRNLATELEVRSIVAPIGLLHPDHVAVADACLEFVQPGSPEVYVVLDGGYCVVFPSVRDARLHDVRGRYSLSPCAEQPATGDKRAAFAAYGSQIRPISEGWASESRNPNVMSEVYSAPEHYFRVGL
jgi:LmbE family N-acetylglucosaminyl deacetylase